MSEPSLADILAEDDAEADRGVEFALIGLKPLAALLPQAPTKSKSEAEAIKKPLAFEDIIEEDDALVENPKQNRKRVSELIESILDESSSEEDLEELLNQRKIAATKKRGQLRQTQATNGRGGGLMDRLMGSIGGAAAADDSSAVQDDEEESDDFAATVTGINANQLLLETPPIDEASLAVEMVPDPDAKQAEAENKAFIEQNAKELQDAQKVLQDIDVQRRKTVEEGMARADQLVQLEKISRVSEQLKDSKMRRSAGKAACVTVGPNGLVCVGTSLGVTLVFDYQQNLSAILGTQQGVEFGSVTALDISADGDWVATGHIRGHVVVWDLNLRRALKVLNEAHFVPVMRVTFLERREHLMSLDVSGNLKRTLLRKMPLMEFLLADTQVVHSVTADERNPIQSLGVLLPKRGEKSRVDPYKLGAWGDAEKVTLVTIGDQIRHLHYIASPSMSTREQVPLLAWRHVPPSDPSEGVGLGLGLGGVQGPEVRNLTMPVLAIAWGHSVMVVGVRVLADAAGDPAEDLDYDLLGEHKLKHNIHAIQWISHSVLALLTVNLELLLFDPFAGMELECRPLGAISPFLQNISNVADENGKDQHPAFVSYQHSLRVFDERLYILSEFSLSQAYLRNWNERISNLTHQKRWLDALTLALDLYFGRAPATGLSRDRAVARREIGDAAKDLLKTFLTQTLQLNRNTSQKMSALLRDRLQLTAAMLSIDCAVSMRRFDLLVDIAYPLFTQAGLGSLLLDSIYPFVIGGKLRSIPGALVQPLFLHYNLTSKRRKLEALVMALELSDAQDFSRYVAMARKLHMTTTFLYLFTNGLDEFVSPLRDLYRLFTSPKLTTPMKHELVVKIINYITQCFEKRIFPTRRRLPRVRARRLAGEIFDFLLVKDVAEFSDPYARLNILIKELPKEALKALAIPFLLKNPTSTRLKEVLPLIHLLFSPYLLLSNSVASVSADSLSWLTEILSKAVLDPNLPETAGDATTSDSWPFGATQQGALLLFFATFAAQGQISINGYARARTLAYLLHSADASTREEREEALWGLVNAAFSSRTASLMDAPDYWLRPEVLTQALDKQFFKVAERFYAQQKQYERMLFCRLHAPAYRPGVFDFVSQLFRDDDLADEDFIQIEATLLNEIQTLIEIDNVKGVASLLLLETFTDMKTILTRLEANRRLQFLYLKGLFAHADSQSKSPNKDDEADDSAAPKKDGFYAPPEKVGRKKKLRPQSMYFKPTSTTDSPRTEVSQKFSAKRIYDLISPEDEEMYVGLMCEFEPNEVYTFLRNESHTHYRDEPTLQIILQHKLPGAAAFVHEKMGNFQEAVSLYLREINACVAELEQLAETNPAPAPFDEDKFPSTPSEKATVRVLQQVIALCQRNTERMTDADNQQLWFTVIDCLVAALKKVKQNEENQAAQNAKGASARRQRLFQDRQYLMHIGYDAQTSVSGGVIAPTERLRRVLTLFIKMVLESMMGFVALNSIMQKMVSDHGKSKLGEFRTIFTSMLDVSLYERNILLTTNRLLKFDAFGQLNGLLSARRVRVDDKDLSPQSAAENAAEHADKEKENAEKKKKELKDKPPAAAPNSTHFLMMEQTLQIVPETSVAESVVRDNSAEGVNRTRLEHFQWKEEESKLTLLDELIEGGNAAQDGSGAAAAAILKRKHPGLELLYNKNAIILSTRTAGRLNAAQSKVNALTEDDVFNLFG